MKRNFSKLISLIMVAVMLCLGTVSSQAAVYPEAMSASVSPRYAHCNDYTFVFSILSDTGEGSFTVTYSSASSFERSKLSVEIQKKFLGVFWRTVDINEPDDVWVCYSYNANGEFHDVLPLDGTGTYRALFTLEILGADGTTDVIEGTSERVY